MGRKGLTLTDYILRGRQLGLKCKESLTPKSDRSPCRWQCMHCGAAVLKSFRNLREGQYPCRCRNGMSLTGDDYLRLAAKLGISWTGSSLPPNTRTDTSWLGKSGITVSTTYAKLAYDKNRYVYEQLGITNE